MSQLRDAPRITPFLWFDSDAGDAVEFYLSIFKSSRRISEMRNPVWRPGRPGSRESARRPSGML
jgi:predicted 3-demethylubiquinone-9 3-methyltransferase (glyoxalase superfamily)